MSPPSARASRPHPAERHSATARPPGRPPWRLHRPLLPAARPPPPGARRAMVVTEASAADGGPARIVVSGVPFDAEQNGYPPYFYAVKNNRVTKYASRNGATVSYLTKPALASTAVSDPQLVGDQVYYLA